ncbi:MAG TPA: formate--tetrahydrofolate ligase [Gaiellaceae bacterium]
MPSSLEIAQSAVLSPSDELAAEPGLLSEEVDFLSPLVGARIEQFTRLGLDDLPICMAKEHLWLSHDSALTNTRTGFVGRCDDMQTMPFLGTTPAAVNFDIDHEGRTVGLF